MRANLPPPLHSPSRASPKHNVIARTSLFPLPGPAQKRKERSHNLTVIVQGYQTLNHAGVSYFYFGFRSITVIAIISVIFVYSFINLCIHVIILFKLISVLIHGDIYSFVHLSMGPFGEALGPEGGRLGPSGAVSGASWAVQGPSWVV